MIPARHRLAADQFAALARGGGGAAAVRGLAAARRSRTRLLIRFVVGSTDSVITRRGYEIISAAHRRAPEHVERVLDHPSVGAWATRTAQRLSNGEATTADDIAGIALAAAVRARMSTTVPVRPCSVLALPSLGTVEVARQAHVTVSYGPTGAAIGTAARIPHDPSLPGPGWRPLDRIVVTSGGHSAKFVIDPWDEGELPPDMDVADQIDVPIWRDRISSAWALLVSGHATVAEELAAAVTVLTPLRTPRAGLSSATTADAFGCLFLSLPADARTAAVTLAHELQHTKLIALMDLFPLLEPVPGETFYAPWRNDPRPLVGLLHGTYAHVGITAFWRAQRTCETSPDARMFAEVEFARWRRSALQVTQTMLNASRRLTPLGRDFVAGMREVLTIWCDEPVSAAALATATRLSGEHYESWLRTYRTWPARG